MSEHGTTRVFRQVVVMEVLWTVGPDWRPEHEHELENGRPKMDGEAIVRDGVQSHCESPDVDVVAGHGTATPPVELTP